jgi:hypothetical protein
MAELADAADSKFTGWGGNFQAVSETPRNWLVSDN